MTIIICAFFVLLYVFFPLFLYVFLFDLAQVCIAHSHTLYRAGIVFSWLLCSSAYLLKWKAWGKKDSAEPNMSTWNWDAIFKCHIDIKLIFSATAAFYSQQVYNSFCCFCFHCTAVKSHCSNRCSSIAFFIGFYFNQQIFSTAFYRSLSHTQIVCVCFHQNPLI